MSQAKNKKTSLDNTSDSGHLGYQIENNPRLRNLLSKATYSMVMLVICIALALVSSRLMAADFSPRPSPVPGGVAVLELPVSIGTEQEPELYFRGQKVFVMNRPYNRKSDDRWIAWVGIPLDAKPGKEALEIRQPDGRTREIMLTVRPSDQPQRFIVSRKIPDTPPQIEQEREILQKLWNRWNNQQPDTRGFLHPTRHPITEEFGSSTFLNNSLLFSKTGVELSGERAVAPADGTVVMIQDLFLEGKTVVIDHGRGLYTLYGRLDKINFRIREGQRIRRGEEIGKIGQSGHTLRFKQQLIATPVTQPSLLWSVVLNGVYVNPELFLSQPEANSY